MDESELKLAEWKKREDIVLQPDDFSLTNEMMLMFKKVSNKLKILYLQEYPIYVTSEQGLDASAKVSIQTAATNIYGVDSLFLGALLPAAN